MAGQHTLNLADCGGPTEVTVDLPTMRFTKTGENVGDPTCRTRYRQLAAESGARLGDVMAQRQFRTELGTALDEIDALRTYIRHLVAQEQP